MNKFLKRFDKLKSTMAKSIGLNKPKPRVNKKGKITLDLEAKRKRKPVRAVKDQVSWEQFRDNPLYMKEALKYTAPIGWGSNPNPTWKLNDLVLDQPLGFNLPNEVNY